MTEPGFDSGDIPGFDDEDFGNSSSNNNNNNSNNDQQVSPPPPTLQMNTFDDDHLYTTKNNNNNNDNTSLENNFDPQQMMQLMGNMQFNNPQFMNTMMQNMMRSSQNNNMNNNNNMMTTMMNNNNQYMMGVNDNNFDPMSNNTMMSYNNNNRMTMQNYRSNYYDNFNNNNGYMNQRMYNNNNNNNTPSLFSAPLVVAAVEETATNTVFISRLNTAMFTEEALLAIASRFGPALKLDVKAHKGIAFIHYRDVAEAKLCVATLRSESGSTLNQECVIGYGKLFEYDADGNPTKVNGEAVVAGCKDFRDKATQELTGSGVARLDKRRGNIDGEEGENTTFRQNNFKVVPLSEEELEGYRNPETGRAANFKFRIGRFKIKNEPTTCIFFGNMMLSSPEMKEEFAAFFKEKFPGFEELTSSQKGTGMMFVHFDTVENSINCLGRLLYEFHGIVLGKKPSGMDFGQPRAVREDMPMQNFNNNNNNEENNQNQFRGRRRQRSQEGNAHNNNNNNNNDDENFGSGIGTDYYSSSIIALPAEFNPDAAQNGDSAHNAKNLSSSFKPKYLNRDRTKSAAKIFSTILDLDNNGSSKPHEGENNNNSSSNENKLKAINSKISGLLTFSYFSCGLFPPHLAPDFVVSLSECVDRAYPPPQSLLPSNNQNHIDISQEPLIAEIDQIMQLNNCSGDFVPHAIAVITKRIQEYFADDDVKKLHVYYLAATALFKNASIQGGSTVSRGLEQFAWLTAVVADGQTSQEALNHIKTVCDGMKASFVHLGNRVHEAFSMLDAVVAVKITLKSDVSDLLAQLDMMS